MGIEEKIFQPNTKYEIENHIYIGKHRVRIFHRPSSGLKMCSVEEMFVESSNIGTIKMIRDIGKCKIICLNLDYFISDIGIPEKQFQLFLTLENN